MGGQMETFGQIIFIFSGLAMFIASLMWERRQTNDSISSFLFNVTVSSSASLAVYKNARRGRKRRNHGCIPVVLWARNQWRGGRRHLYGWCRSSVLVDDFGEGHGGSLLTQLSSPQKERTNTPFFFFYFIISYIRKYIWYSVWNELFFFWFPSPSRIRTFCSTTWLWTMCSESVLKTRKRPS